MPVETEAMMDMCGIVLALGLVVIPSLTMAMLWMLLLGGRDE